jgi:glycosyltransferase involved in cell wall biosynthesis
LPKVIHIVENLDRGATETWLVRMLRFAAAKGVRLDWTFYCTLETKGAMEDEAIQLGARVIHSPVPLADKIRFVRALRSELKRGGYDVLHSHHDLVSGVYLVASAGLPIDRRLVHVHNAGDALPSRPGFRQSALKMLLRQICLTMADRIVGISNNTLDTFLAGRTRRKNRDVVHYCGVDSAPFENPRADRAGFRKSVGLPDTARIVLFAGRIVPEKEPLFAVDVMAEMNRADPDVVGVFAGTGSLSQAVTEKATSLGLQEHFRNLGWHANVADIMACCDCFIQPGPEEPMEGLGLAVVEAQLAGLPLLVSRGIPDDALLAGASCRRIPLAAGAKKWADAGIELLNDPRPSRTRTLEALNASPFEMNHALSDLMLLHSSR